MFDRRSLLKALVLSATGCRTPRAPAPTENDVERAHAMCGDVQPGSAIIWTRGTAPGRMHVEWSTDPRFASARQVEGSLVAHGTGLCGKARLVDLPPGREVFYRARVGRGPWVSGRLKTTPAQKSRVRFGFSGDTVGQGWGIDESRGGLLIYPRLLAEDFDFFIHSGDLVYSDGPLRPVVRLAGGALWRNRMTPAKAKVAETQDEFRGQFLYNLLDEGYARFHREVPLIAQWDDHETRNNWYPGQILTDSRYREKRVDVLSARARQAFVEHTPIAWFPGQDGRIYRHVPYGPMLDVFVLDARTHRGPNNENRRADGQPYLGQAQLTWLIDSLRRSAATWKVIAHDMPLSLVVKDGDTAYEAVANGDAGPPAGREVEIATLLRSIKDVPNVVWVTADVHFCAAHHYAPERAQGGLDFRPFWELVAGPMHAGTFGPNELDPTFGPERVFQSTPPGTLNRPPSDGLQFYGVGTIDERGGLTLELKNLAGEVIFSRALEPEAAP